MIDYNRLRLTSLLIDLAKPPSAPVDDLKQKAASLFLGGSSGGSTSSTVNHVQAMCVMELSEWSK